MTVADWPERGAFGVAQASWPKRDLVFVVVLTLVVRAALLGLPPHADEGHYAAAAYFHFHAYVDGRFAGPGWLPTFGALEVYPLLLSPLWSLPWAPLPIFRVADALFAAWATLGCCLFLRAAVGRRWPALVATVLFVLVVNHPAFIEAGGRNPIALAMALFFAAAWLMHRPGASAAAPWVAGVLMGCAVLVREPFIAFAGTWWLASVALYGPRVSARVALAAVGTLAVGVLTIATLKGGWVGWLAIVQAYRHTPATDPGFNLSLIDRLVRLAGIVGDFAGLTAFAWPIAAIGLLAPAVSGVRRIASFGGLYALAIALVLASLVEVVVKRPYTYHLAQAMLGGSLLLAMGACVLGDTWRRLRPRGWRAGACWAVCGVLQIALVGPLLRQLWYQVGWSAHYAPAMLAGDLAAPVVDEAYYLKMADLVRRHSRPDQPVLSTSTNVYPLAGRFPVTRALARLDVYLRFTGQDVLDAAALAILKANPPAVVVLESNAHMPAQAKRMARIQRQLGPDYRPLATLGPGLSPYRQFSALLLVRDDPSLSRGP